LVISKDKRAVSSKSQVAGKGRPAHKAQFTYKGTRLGREYPKGNIGKTMNN